MYTPDRWVVIEIETEEHGKVQRVFGGWYGGFTTGDSWRLNSGIESVEEFITHFEFIGYSGSVYKCYKSAYGMSSYMMSIYASMEKQLQAVSNASIKIVEGYSK